MLPKLVVIFCFLLGQSAAGQEPITSEEPHGLLGQRYVSGLLSFQQPPRHHQAFYDFDATSTFALNLPVKWTEDNFAAFSQDVFFSLSDLNPFQNEKSVARNRFAGDNIGNFMGVQVTTDPITGVNASSRIFDTSMERIPATNAPSDRYLSMGRFQGQRFQIGTTLYGAIRHDIRPFVQIGYACTKFRQHTDINITYSSSQANGNFLYGPGPAISQSCYHRMICNAGIEWDLNERLTLRPQIDLDTRYFGKGTRCSAQLIWWLKKDWFLSPGILCNIDGTQPGGLVNVGCSF